MSANTSGVEIIPPSKPRRRKDQRPAIYTSKVPRFSNLIEVPFTPELLTVLRYRLRDGSEQPSPTKPVYKSGNLRIRTSRKSIVLCAQIYFKLRKQPRTITLTKIPVDQDTPITQALIDEATAALVTEKNAAGSLQYGAIKDKAEEKENAAKSNRALFDEWCELPRVRSLKTLPEMKYIIEKHFLKRPLSRTSTYGDVPPTYFSKGEAQKWIDAIQRDHGQATARKARCYVNSMFSHLVKNASIRADDAFPQTRKIEACDPRETYLTSEQLKRLWTATEKLSDTERDFVQTIFLTAQRERQITHLRWEWVDLNEKVIRFPKTIMKGRKPDSFDCPLSEPVIDILTRRKDAREKLKPHERSESVFPSRSGAPICNLPKLAAKIDHILAGKKTPRHSRRDAAPFRWCFHDARRTAIALLENSDDPLAEALTTSQLELVLAHKQIRSGQALRSYSRGRLEKQKRRLMELLAKEILKIVKLETQSI